jgi:hypothetical protein
MLRWIREVLSEINENAHGGIYGGNCVEKRWKGGDAGVLRRAE